MNESRKKAVRKQAYPSVEEEIGPVRPQTIREVNARRVLRLLRQQGPCSRADLVRYSGLSAPTISSGVEYLQGMGLVEPIGTGSSSGGRPPQLIQFNSKLGYVIGADIGTAVVRTILADLDGAIIGEWVTSTNSRSTPDRVLAIIWDSIRKLRNRHNIPEGKIVAAAAGVPGITNARTGTVLSAPILTSGWHDVPLRQMLEARTAIPAVVENDVNLAALGERWDGTARGVKNFVFLTVGSGVGAGIFLDGSLYHGSDWAAGEIGYLYVPGIEDTPLVIRRPGSLESTIGARAIEESWRKICDAGHAPPSPFPRELSVTEIFDLAANGENRAAAILKRTARILADAITDVCVILNIPLVVIGGRVGSHFALFEATRQIIERNEFCRPRLALSGLGLKAPLHGALRLALTLAATILLPSSIERSRVLTSEGIASTVMPIPPHPRSDKSR